MFNNFGSPKPDHSSIWFRGSLVWFYVKLHPPECHLGNLVQSVHSSALMKINVFCIADACQILKGEIRYMSYVCTKLCQAFNILHNRGKLVVAASLVKSLCDTNIRVYDHIKVHLLLLQLN